MLNSARNYLFGITVLLVTAALVLNIGIWLHNVDPDVPMKMFMHI